MCEYGECWYDCNCIVKILLFLILFPLCVAAGAAIGALACGLLTLPLIIIVLYRIVKMTCCFCNCCLIK